MDDLKSLFDEIQSELLKLTESYQRKVQLIEEMLTESDIRILTDSIQSKLAEILALIQGELTTDKENLKVWERVNSKLEEFSKLMTTDDYEAVFEWLHRRRFNRVFEEIHELREVGNYSKKIEAELAALKKVLLEQEALALKLLQDYDFKDLLRLFNLILHAEFKSYVGYSFHTPDEDFIVHGLYLHIEKASQELIEMCSLLEDEVGLLKSSEGEDKEAIDFVNFLIRFVEENAIKTVIFIDKSARPFSYAFLLLYRKKHLIGRPKIININWHKTENEWSKIKYSELWQNEYTEAYKSKDFDKIREIVVGKNRFYAELYENCRNKNVLIVDEVNLSQGTLESLKEFIERLFSPKKVFIYVFRNQYRGFGSIPAFIEGIEFRGREHSWIKSMTGIGLIDLRRGYSSTIFREYKKYKPQFDHLHEKISKAKRHIEEAVQKYG